MAVAKTGRFDPDTAGRKNRVWRAGRFKRGRPQGAPECVLVREDLGWAGKPDRGPLVGEGHGKISQA